MRRVVIDTNVLVSALRSNLGASFKLISLLDQNLFQIHVSVPLVFEYESVLKREKHRLGLTLADIDDFLDYLCSIAMKSSGIFYLWRPYLKDPADDFVLELAIESGSHYIITHNLVDFDGCERFGIHVVAPGPFLKIIGAL